MNRRDLWTQQGKEKMGQTDRAALTYTHHHVVNGYWWEAAL